MSKYDALWAHVRELDRPRLVLSFDEIERIARMPLDHSFLTHKKELLEYGYAVGKISMKARTVLFIRTEDA